MRHYPCGPKVPGWPQRGSIAHRNPSGLMFNMNSRPYRLVLAPCPGGSIALPEPPGLGNPRHRDQTEVRIAHACDLSRPVSVPAAGLWRTSRRRAGRPAATHRGDRPRRQGPPRGPARPAAGNDPRQRAVMPAGRRRTHPLHKSRGRPGPLRRQFQSGKPGTSMAVIRAGFLIPWPVIQTSA